jgi:TRAP-type C4-dicarboxylate transport system substrate-binding protein
VERQERPHKTFEDFCERVKVLTNGRLEIEPYPAGAIVPTNETLTALQVKAPRPSSALTPWRAAPPS